MNAKLLICCLLFFVTNVFAERCPILRVAADKAWPPYSRAVGGGFVGVGPRIINVAFGELQIPVVFTPIDLALENGERFKFQGVDLVLATYKRPDWVDYLKFVEPAYAFDKLAVVFRNEPDHANVSWHAWTHGAKVSAADFMMNESFDHEQPYLFIKQESSNRDLLQFLHDRKYDYAVGSRAQIQYVSHDLGLDAALKLRSEPGSVDPIFLAFVKDSPCAPYAAYLKQRLIEWRRNGTLARWLEEMTPKEPGTPAVGLEALG